MLKQRVFTAVILIAVALGTMLWSPTAFAVMATTILGLALAEWLQLAGATRAMAIGLAMIVFVLLLALAIGARDLIGLVVLPFSAAASIVWLVISAALVQPGVMALKLPRAAGVALAITLVLAAWLAMMSLLSEGVIMLLSVLVIVWTADTVAYFAGRAFGRRKLAPHISPGKTWAGVVGAALAVMLLALVVWLLAPASPLYSNDLFAAAGAAIALLLLAVLVAMSVMGDLFESLLKRQAGVKDSGQMLPGHGGILDRVDALVPVLPAAVVIHWLVR